MRNLDYIEKDSNNDFIVRFNTNNNFDRTSLYLYPNATNTGYASHPPHIEEYGCESFNVFQRYAQGGNEFINFEDDDDYNQFDPFGSSSNSQTYLERFCPQYQAAKLYPSKRNPNNSLSNKIGAINLTFLAKHRLASPFFYNGTINGVAPAGLGNNGVPSPYVCYNKCKTITSGYQSGPRFTLVSNNIAITAKHYTNPDNPENLVGNVYTIIGTDDIEYAFQIIYAETSGYETSLDLHVCKIQGYGANPIETGIALNKIKPISLLDGNYSTIEEELLFKNYISSIAPVITIDHENRTVLDIKLFMSCEDYGFKQQPDSNLFSYYSLNEYLEKFNLDTVFTVEDIQSYAFVGDSSSPYFILENNTPVLLGLYTTYNDIYNAYLESKYNTLAVFIKNFAIEHNCNLPNIIKLNKNNLIQKINQFNTSSDNLIYLLPNISYYKDTDNTLQKNLTVFHIQNDIKYEIQNNIFYSTAINFLNLKTLIFSLGFNLRTNPEYFIANYTLTKPTTEEQEQDPEIYCTEDIKVNYDKTQTDYNNFIKSNIINKKLLSSIGLINYHAFTEKLHKQSTILLKRNKTYYFNIDLNLNNFYVSKEPNNLTTKYDTGFKRILQKMYYELSPEITYNIDLQTINLHNLECDYESVSFPIQHNINFITRGDLLTYCDEPSVPEVQVALSSKDYFLLKFEVPSDCPSKLYFCTDAGYVEILIEDEKPILEKTNKISYLNITPKIKITNNQELDFGVSFEQVEDIISPYFRACRNILPCQPCYPVLDGDPATEEYNNYIKSILDEKYFYTFSPDKTKLNFIKDKKIKSSDNFDINIIRKE